MNNYHNIPVCGSLTANTALYHHAQLSARQSYENEAHLYNIMNSTDDHRLRGSHGVLNTMDHYVTTTAGYPSNVAALHSATSLGGLLTGSNTRLTYSLTPSLGSTEGGARIVNPLHTVLSGNATQLHGMVDPTAQRPNATHNIEFMSVPIHHVGGEALGVEGGAKSLGLNGADLTSSGDDISNSTALSYLLNPNSQFQSGIELCQATMNSNLISTNSFSVHPHRTDTYSIISSTDVMTTDSYSSMNSTILTTDTSYPGIQTAPSLPHAPLETSLNGHVETTTSEMGSVISTTNVSDVSSIVHMSTCLPEVQPTESSSGDLCTPTTTEAETLQTSEGLTSTCTDNPHTEYLSSTSGVEEEEGSEPNCKKPRIDEDVTNGERDTTTMINGEGDTTVTPVVNGDGNAIIGEADTSPVVNGDGDTTTVMDMDISDTTDPDAELSINSSITTDVSISTSVAAPIETTTSNITTSLPSSSSSTNVVDHDSVMNCNSNSTVSVVTSDISSSSQSVTTSSSVVEPKVVPVVSSVATESQEVTTTTSTVTTSSQSEQASTGKKKVNTRIVSTTLRGAFWEASVF